MNGIIKKFYIEDDILLVHKPVGITSFDVVRKLRPILGTRKIGHAGTLDPLAYGLMIIGINKGTKKLNNYLKLPKTYITNILVGTSTTTGDKEGDVIEEKYITRKDMNSKKIEDILICMKGIHVLKAPLYSAIKVQGKALYAYAREGKNPPYIPEKEMNILAIQYLDSYKKGLKYIVRARITVSSGTYIRTLGEEFGRRIGYPARLDSLYRVAIDGHLDADSYHFPVEKKNSESTFRAILNKLIS